MSVFNILNRETLNGLSLSHLNFNQVYKYLNDSLDGDWNEKVPLKPVPFKAFCRTNYANKHMIESCIMVEGDINGSDMLTGVTARFYFRNNSYNTDDVLGVMKPAQTNNSNISYSIVDTDRGLKYDGGNDEKLNSIIKEYKRLVNPLEIRTLTGKIDIIGYELYHITNSKYSNMTSLEMLHKIYELENEYLEVFDNL